MQQKKRRSDVSPLVWYVAAHYNNPGGIEVYLLHYATELKRRGFDTRIVVFDPLPAVEHRCLRLLRERGIPIESLSRAVEWQAGALTALLYVPWALATSQRSEVGGNKSEVRSRSSESNHSDTPILRHPVTFLPPSSHPACLYRHMVKRLALGHLKRRIAREQPDIIHVKGRIMAEAWDVLPAGRTVVHIATEGRRDSSWEDGEVRAFRSFAERCARVLVPGSGVGRSLRQEFGLVRNPDVVFTMAPDERGEVGGQRSEVRGQGPEGGGRRADGRTAFPECERPTSNIERRSPESDVQRSMLDVRCWTFADNTVCPMSGAVSSDQPEAGAGGLRRFGFLGRLHEEKGLRELLKALEMLQRDGVAVPFLFAGAGPMEDEIRAFVASAQRNDVRLEAVESPALSLEQMDVVVLPSNSEAMPLVLVEGLMCGRPCIATAVGGVPDLIRDEAEGMLIFPPASARNIAAAIRRFMAMAPSEFDEFRKRARERYEEMCTPERVGAIIEGYYRTIIARGVEQ